MKISTRLKVALPSILVFGIIGALVGGAMGDAINGIRGGIIAGGIFAFFYLQRKNSK